MILMIRIYIIYKFSLLKRECRDVEYVIPELRVMFPARLEEDIRFISAPNVFNTLLESLLSL
jgi:hypothetical protein